MSARAAGRSERESGSGGGASGERRDDVPWWSVRGLVRQVRGEGGVGGC